METVGRLVVTALALPAVRQGQQDTHLVVLLQLKADTAQDPWWEAAGSRSAGTTGGRFKLAGYGARARSFRSGMWL